MKDRLKAWVKGWASASSRLQRTRDDEIRSAQTGPAIRAFASNFLWLIRQNRPSHTSGLIEQQRLFARLRP